MAAENTGKVYVVGIAAQGADFSHRRTGKAQKIFGLLHAQGSQKLPGGLAGFLQKAPVEAGMVIETQEGFGKKEVRQS